MESIEKERRSQYLFDFLGVLVEDVLADEVGSLELLAGQRTQPLVLAKLLSVGLELKNSFTCGGS